MQFVYDTIENHVAMRDGLPSAFRPTLLEQTKSDWTKHPRYSGKAEFFMNLHRNLIDGTDQVSRSLEKMLDRPDADLFTMAKRANLVDGTRHLINFAHGHHHIEDHGYFPHFIQLYPQLERVFELMDGDHKILDEALHGAEAALDNLENALPTKDNLAQLYAHTHALEKIITRHIHDEEEVIIPIFLRHT